MADQPSLVSKRRALALVALCCLASNLPGQTTNVSVVPPPDWVRLCEWGVSTNRLGSEKGEGSRYLLHERQENPQRKESFFRVVLLMENQTGVQDSGSLSFGFDPSFQELLLHRVQIHRDGKVLERLDRSKVRIIQPEPDLDGHLFTGRQTAVLFLEDLRFGDALEYAYTIRGANPILDGHYAARFMVQSSVPMGRLLGLNVLAVGLFFAKRKVFPRIDIALLVANAAFLLTDEIVGGRIPYVAGASDASSARDVLHAALQAIIWCGYVLQSKRVKATFVR